MDVSVALTTDNPPFWSNAKNTRGALTIDFPNLSHLKKKTGGTLTINFQNLSHLKKSNKGDPYYQFSKYESPEKKKTRGSPYYQFSKFESLEKKVRVPPLCFGKMMKKSNLKIQKNKGVICKGGLSVGNATDGI